MPSPPPKRIDNELVDAVVELTFAVQAILTDVAKESGLTLAQLRLLGVVRDHQPTMMELAAHLGLDKSSVSGLIDRAEARRLVRRESVAEDGRAYRVVITTTGRDFARSTAATVSRRLTTLLGSIDAPQRAILTAVIREVLDDAQGLINPDHRRRAAN